MSERISKEEARQLVRAKSAEHNKVDSSTEHGAIASSVAAILSKKGLASTYQKEVKSLNLSSAKRFIHKLVDSLNSDSPDFALQQIESIADCFGDTAGRASEIHLLALLLRSALNSNDKQKNRKVAIQALLEHLLSKRGISSIYEALQTLITAPDNTPGKSNLFLLIRLLSTEPKSSRALLTLPSVLIVVTSLCHCWSSAESEQGLYIFAQTLVKVLHQLLTSSADLSFLTPNLVRIISVTIQSHKVFHSTQELKRLSQIVSEKILNDRAANEEQTSSNSITMAEHSSTAGTRAAIDIKNILADLGSATTRSTSTLRDTLSEITRNLSNLNNESTNTSIDESAIASIIFFFSERGSKQRLGDGVDSSAMVGALTNDNDIADKNSWDLNIVSQVLSEDYSHLDWRAVAHNFDFPEFMIRDNIHLVAFLSLYKVGAKDSMPLAPFVSEWRNQSGQLSFLENVLSVSPNIFKFPVDEAESADAATVAEGKSNCPNPQGWASVDVLKRLLQISDVPSLVRRVRDLFVKGLLTCPEVLLCSLVRLQLSFATAQQGNMPNANAGMQMKGELMKELIPLFFKPTSHHRIQNSQAAFRRLWAISPNTVAAACLEAWRSTTNDTPQIRRATIVHVISISRMLLSPENATATILNWDKDYEFSIAVACIMADLELLNLINWLTERCSSSTGGTMFIVSVVAFISKTYSAAVARATDPRSGGPLLSLENLLSCLQFLQGLDKSLLNQTISNPASGSGFSLGESVKTILEACLNTHPSINSSLSKKPSTPGSSSRPSTPTPSTNSVDDIEEMANSYFQKIYTSEQSIGEVVEMLKRFKTSGNARENDIFACMIHNLFDEYRFFAKYPEKELRITGILFGRLIKEQLVSSITLGIALRYVLEALRKPPSQPGSNSNSGKMFRFGMFALEQFKERLHEWPQYCSHIVLIQHLKEGYADLVSEIERAMPDNVNRQSSGASSGMTSNDANSTASDKSFKSSGELSKQIGGVPKSVDVRMNATPTNTMVASVGPTNLDLTQSVLSTPRVAVFGPRLGRAVNGEFDGSDSQHEAPPDAILDRVQFLINNVTMNNVEQKALELKEMLAPQFFGWLGHYLVVKRISCQPNFHSVYLAFLDQLGDYGKGLVEAILSSVYLNVGKLLRSPKITTSTQERSLLKNLGSWLGQITLARNRPILQIMLDCKELLFQGYETGMLIAVTPFVAKILEGAKKSIVFRPPNPWLMGLLSVFRALYGVDDLKMNIKFEVEVLCKNLGVKLEDILLRTDDLAKRIPPVKARNPDFNMKSSMANQPPSGVNVVPSTSTAVAGQGSNGNSVNASLTSPDGKQPAVGAGTTLKTSVSLSGAGGAAQFGGNNSTSGSNTGGSDQQQTVIPNLAAYVSINSCLLQLFQQAPEGSVLLSITNASLKRAVPIAVDRAIREIIQPVVERSVTIACITTKEIVTKDFAMESDENKMRKAAQLMVANLAGSLALVTCREPLRASVSTHLRQLLVNSNANQTSGTNSAQSNPQLGEQEQGAIEQCVAVCANDNLELGCMLIEKAATEKAVRDMDEALSGALNSRKKHREQTGQPFYDMSIFNNNSRYPGALPDPLRPQPGGLRNDQLLVYEAFQRMPRQPSNVGTTQQSNAPGTSTSPISGANNANGALPGKPNGQPINVENLSAITTKLDSVVTALLSAAGPRAPEITLSKLPLDHEIKQILSAAQRITSAVSPARPLTTTESDSILVFAQGVFKRLYELSLSEPLRLESLVAMLEAVNKCCPQLGQDLGTWATYAPTETESQRKLHRTVLLLLLRSHLVNLSELDEYLSRSMDGGRNAAWLEFTLLLVRTAVLERIAVPNDLPKVIGTLRNVGDGLVQNQQILQTYRSHVVRLLEEISGSNDAGRSASDANSSTGIISTNSSLKAADKLTHQQSSSISAASLTNLAEATKRAAEAINAISREDPPNLKAQVTYLLDGWMRIQNESTGNEKALQFTQHLQQLGVGNNDDQTERFFRLSTELLIEAVTKSTGDARDARTQGESKRAQGKVLNYTVIDSYSKLVSLMIHQMNPGGNAEQAATKKISLLNKVLGITVRTMMAHYERSKQSSGGVVSNWDQRPWFRLLLNFVLDLCSPSPTLDPISYGILSVFGSAFHVVQPLVIPGFAFAWLELMSHRMFLSNLLLVKGQKGWALAHQLLIDLFLFLEPHLRKTELTDAMKHLYKGTLRVLLVLLHDYPAFLAGYHLSFCNVIPENCVQLRNLVLSAFPRDMRLPDPFTPNLKIDLLPEISKSPVILSDVSGPIATLRNELDSYLKSRQPSDFVKNLLPRLLKSNSKEIDAPRVNALVLYVGVQAINRLQNSQTSHALAHSPEMEVLQKLMELNDRGSYIALNAIANQLRYPSSHTHYYSCVMLYLFSEATDEGIKEQITRVLLERLIVQRPHPWGLLITFIELIKNQRYQFWSHPFTRCATEIEKVFESVARSCMPPGSQRSTTVGGADVPQ